MTFFLLKAIFALSNTILTTQPYLQVFGWTPRRVFLVGPLWLDPSPLPFKGEISLPNTILTTQRYLRVFGWTPRICLLKAKFHSLTRFFLHNDICGFLVGPLAFAFKRPFSPSLTPRR